MGDVQTLIEGAVALGALLVTVFTVGRFTGRVERGIKALDCKLESMAAASAAAHTELRERIQTLDDRLAAHIQASIPQPGD